MYFINILTIINIQHSEGNYPILVKNINYIISGQCLTHSECGSGEKCVLTAIADRSGRFTQACVQDQPTSNNENDYKGSLNRVPEVIETEPTDIPVTNQRPQSKINQWQSTINVDSSIYLKFRCKLSQCQFFLMSKILNICIILL